MRGSTQTVLHALPPLKALAEGRAWQLEGIFSIFFGPPVHTTLLEKSTKSFVLAIFSPMEVVGGLGAGTRISPLPCVFDQKCNHFEKNSTPAVVS